MSKRNRYRKEKKAREAQHAETIATFCTPEAIAAMARDFERKAREWEARDPEGYRAHVEQSRKDAEERYARCTYFHVARGLCMKCGTIGPATLTKAQEEARLGDLFEKLHADKK